MKIKNIFCCSKLQKWAINENVTHSTLNSLLNILRAEPGYNYWPKDARTFLKTPNITHAKKLRSGLYYYFRINETLSNLCNKQNIKIKLNQEILSAATVYFYLKVRIVLFGQYYVLSNQLTKLKIKFLW